VHEKISGMMEVNFGLYCYFRGLQYLILSTSSNHRMSGGHYPYKSSFPLVVRAE